MNQQRQPEPRPADGAGAGTDGPTRYASFGDYLRVVRRHKWLVLAVTAAFVGATLAFSASQETTYRAQAQLAFRDLLADLNLFGISDAVPELAPAQLSQINAELLDRPEVTARVQKRITGLTREELESSVSGQVGVQTNLVQVDAEADEAKLAARLANEYAEAARQVGNAEQHRRLRDAEDAIGEELEEAKDDNRRAPGSATVRTSVLEQAQSRVEFLLQVAEPVRIAERADVPEGPASPTAARNAILGAMVGLVLGLLAAFARDSLDRRLHSATELHEELGVPVLGRVPKSAFGQAGLAANGTPPMAEDDFEAFRVLRTNLAALRPVAHPRSILVTSGVPEEGKSTVSMALASAATAAGQRTLLVECDLRRPSFADRLGVSEAPGLTDYLLGQAGPQDVLQTVELSLPGGTNGSAPARGSAGTLVCIAAGTPVANPAELLISPRFRTFLERVSGTYDLVVLDGGPLLSIVDPLQLVSQVEAVLVCVRARRATRDQVRASRAALSNLPERPVGAVLTGLRRRGPDAYVLYHGY